MQIDHYAASMWSQDGHPHLVTKWQHPCAAHKMASAQDKKVSII